MKATTYTCDISNGQRTEIRARSAGEAIYQSLAQFPGCTVTACHSGMDEKQVAAVFARGASAIAGITSFEVPIHKALTEEQAAQVRGEEPEE